MILNIIKYPSAEDVIDTNTYTLFSHVASIAAGNAGVPVIVDGFYYGRASGMAPRAR